MKALDILESLQLAIFDANIKNTSIKFSNTHIENIQEAIEELESLEQQNTALQARIKELEEHKTCLTCKHFTQCDDDFNYCNVKSHLNGFINYTFGCIFHEPKTTK